MLAGLWLHINRTYVHHIWIVEDSMSLIYFLSKFKFLNEKINFWMVIVILVTSSIWSNCGTLLFLQKLYLVEAAVHSCSIELLLKIFWQILKKKKMCVTEPFPNIKDFITSFPEVFLEIFREMAQENLDFSDYINGDIYKTSKLNIRHLTASSSFTCAWKL